MTAINLIIAIYMIFSVLFFALCIHASMTSNDVRQLGAIHPRYVSAIVVLTSVFLSAVWPVVIWLARRRPV